MLGRVGSCCHDGSDKRSVRRPRVVEPHRRRSLDRFACMTVTASLVVTAFALAACHAPVRLGFDAARRVRLTRGSEQRARRVHDAMVARRQ
jgi:hypothetical protein